MLNNYRQQMSCSTESPESSIKICIAMTPEEKREIYRFRYQTYIEEMSKHPEEVDYDSKLLYDEMDEWAVLLYAKVNSEIIATKRVNIGTIADFPKKILGFLSLETFQNFNTEHGERKFAYITKVMIAPAHRSSPVLYLLIAKCYEICCHKHVQFIFGACNFHLLHLYEHLGCRRYCKNFHHSGYGLLAPIVLLIEDIQYFRKVRSPLFRIARNRGVLNTKAIEWFDTMVTNNLPSINSQIIKEEELWSILCKRLNCLPTEAITLLHGLSEAAAKKFLHSCGIVVQCYPEDLITVQGDVSYSYNILISGRLKSLTFHRPIKEYITPGQHFGANGLTEHNKHREDIAAISSAEILVLSGICFQKFHRSHPDIAHKIVQNSISLTRKSYLD
ncbi:hypothetical protein SPSIL_007310 [Sporomusa silvacetica DSM 10669]|uniref:Cyclic nucleotide-binding domain-containing protein n=1 Tax=Sporomusa silvacetica DSM 10669 TaxID=1123289 RepID=A0ABZ3IG22_9FIRM|nr:GNAT family N-acyltransferase [Sporomusa silvacetica]OZC16483.1 hypothetical protein SPSIL_37660 [Sporomusa silvacetica DSM 10669]